ncbi:lycopene cyclase domain-containing protein [Microbacterium sp. GXF0217]
MTYSLLALVFLALAAAGAIAAALVARRRPDLGAVMIALAALLLLTAVFDTIMIGVGFFTYADEHLLGVLIGLAPIEDFAYPLAGVILLPAIWTLLRARRVRATAIGRADR